MQKRYKIGIVLVVLCMLCLSSQKTFASNKTKDEEKEYDFNEETIVSISKKESYTESGKYTWLKYKPNADGYLTVEASDPTEPFTGTKGYLALYNSAKTKLLSSSTIFYNTAHSDNSYWYKFIFGMQKGSTYYIRVKSESAVKFTCQYKKVKDVSGISRIKAKNLKKNKVLTGLVPAGISNADWYQIRLTKKQKLRLYYNAKTNGCFKISIYMGTKLIGTRNIYYTSGLRKITLSLKINGKKSGMSAGKYYVKIERANTMSSGYYKIKWN